MPGVTDLLSVDGLSVEFDAARARHRAVSGVSFAISKGETFALVGESGCGKSTLALALLRLLPDGGHIVGGRVTLDGLDLLTLPERDMERVRGRRVSCIFQDPQACLNPVSTVGEQLAFLIRFHHKVSRDAAQERATALLREVHLPDPERVERKYAYELSGGMCQRVLIAMALSCEPQLLIADEPTSALDVTTQAGIVRLLREVQQRLHMGMLFITHDLFLASRIADRVGVMYQGKMVEVGPAADLFSRPQHDYTRALVASARLTEVVGPRHELD